MHISWLVPKSRIETNWTGIKERLCVIGKMNTIMHKIEEFDLGYLCLTWLYHYVSSPGRSQVR